jgi:prepilin-type N-terminal cleavage/methylation domain-containing protein
VEHHVLTGGDLVLTNQRGLTLVEALLAMAIIGIALVAISAMIPSSIFGVQQGKQASAATFLADQRLEQVKNAQWSAAPAVDSLGLSPSPASPPASGGVVTFADENPVAGYPGYRRTIRITDVSPAGSADTLRQVTVSVFYNPMTAAGVATFEQSARLTMLIAKR